jgi:hypothetical protein
MPVFPGGRIIGSMVNGCLHSHEMQSTMHASNSDVAVISGPRIRTFRHNAMNLKGISQHSLGVSRTFVDTG